MLVEGDAATVERALAREIELWEAYKNRDIATLERLIDPLALDVGPWGAITRDRVFRIVAEYEIATYQIDQLAVAVLSNIEILTYEAYVEAMYVRKAVTSNLVRCSSVWFATHDGQWRLGHRHEAPMAAD